MAFGACLAFGLILAWLYGRPCPAASTASSGQGLLLCSTEQIAAICNVSSATGLAFFGMALLCGSARRAETRRENVIRLRQVRASERHRGLLRIHTTKRWSDKTSDDN
ncbi:hypothetical protein [Novosphingobium mangrovi (ex Hu et al. 2023)]|uniref:Uncharacterized protein n=1 Tax=Novosphingobium mangrovi (ex Hu et al. 2023) TaxID=2930094 RepID=A0ABT0A7L7_9SPHN|nr:hypothetical protein [Novosphingobium mangrovi (ex Hu et al. 2023)]MCJ1959196.1 hypothetical protein [Novosphingobium mangrovi (ex Hu et al. 2023)]